MNGTTYDLLAVLLSAVAGVVGPRGSAPGSARLRAVVPTPGRGGAGEPAGRLGAVTRAVFPAEAMSRLPFVVGVAAAGLLLAGKGAVAAPLLVGAVLVAARTRRRRAAEAARSAQVARDLPRTADLLATCLSAGLPPADAVTVVSEVVDGPVAELLRPVSTALRAGVDPALAWHRAGAADAGTGRGDAEAPVHRLARAFARAASTGAPLADTLTGVADDERLRLRWAAEASARRAGVRAVGPLAVCFLPAFLLLGVVPVVAGVAAQVLVDLA